MAARGDAFPDAFSLCRTICRSLTSRKSWEYRLDSRNVELTLVELALPRGLQSESPFVRIRTQRKNCEHGFAK